MDLSSAINVIESVAGFTDADTAVGEAWAVVTTQLQAAPVPVPVSERLPGPEDCDGEGRCWWWCPSSVLPNGMCPYWCLAPAESPRPWFTHWLPATALPLPAGEVEE
jgi:hypothetical protein